MEMSYRVVGVSVGGLHVASKGNRGKGKIGEDGVRASI